MSPTPTIASPAVNLRDYLAEANVGKVGAITPNGWLLSASRLPDKATDPDRVICLTDSGGRDPEPRLAIDNPNVQVMVRGDRNGYIAAYRKAYEVKTALLSLPSQQVGDLYVIGIWQRGDIGMIGYDQNERPLLTLNFLLKIAPVEPGNRTPLE